MTRLFVNTVVLLSLQAQPSTVTVAPAGRLFQVIVNVRDMRTELVFWRDVMGFPVVYPPATTDPFREVFVRLDAGGVLLALHVGRKSGREPDDSRLSFMVDDLVGVRNRLRAKGVKLSEPRSPTPGVFVVDGRDPEGNAFHFENHAGLERRLGVNRVP